MSDNIASDMLAGRFQGDPFSFLGQHEADKGWVIRTIQPGAMSVSVETPEGKPLGEMMHTLTDGFFTLELPDAKEYTPYKLKIKWSQFNFTNISSQILLLGISQFTLFNKII